MPAPIQISRRTQPTDIDNLYDFVDQSTPYSSSIESDNGSYIPKLEANFCRNFSCCGLNLEDLHDLLQHYEECHVRFEHDDGHQFIDDWSSTDGSAPSSPQPSHTSLPSKKNALVSLSDIYSESNETSAFDTSILRTPYANKKKRSIGSISPDALQSSKRLAYSSAFSTPDSSMPSTPTSTSYGPEVVDILNGTTGSLFATQFGMPAGTSPYAVAAEEILLRKRDQELAMLDQHISRPATTLVVDKPYKCQVAGCDKAYKNPNGLKYHNQHGHCNNNNGIDGDKPINKPYKCSIIECGKRYKNLNGLKYHVQHTHMPHQAMQALH